MKISTWNDLSMRERAAYIKAGVNNGIYDLNTIRNSYNSFAEGGSLDNGGPLSSYKNSSGNYIFDNNKDVLTLSKYMSNNGLYINSADRDSRGWAGVKDGDGLTHYVSPTIENKLRSLDPSFVKEDLPRAVVKSYLARDTQGKILRKSDGTPISFNSAEEREEYYRRRRLDNYVSNMNDAYKYLDKNNPEWRKTYGMTPDMKTLNTVTGGALNWLSPTQVLGNATNLVKLGTGNMDLDEFGRGLVEGNYGVGEAFGRDWAQEHPGWNLFFNMLGDGMVIAPTETEQLMNHVLSGNWAHPKAMLDARLYNGIVKTGEYLGPIMEGNDFGNFAHILRTANDLIQRPKLTFNTIRSGNYPFTNRGFTKPSIVNRFKQEVTNNNLFFDGLINDAKYHFYYPQSSDNFIAYHNNQGIHLPLTISPKSNIPSYVAPIRDKYSLGEIATHEGTHYFERNRMPMAPNAVPLTIKDETGGITLGGPQQDYYSYFDGNYYAPTKVPETESLYEFFNSKSSGEWTKSPSELFAELTRLKRKWGAKFRSSFDPEFMKDKSNIEKLMDRMKVPQSEKGKLWEPFTKTIENMWELKTTPSPDIVSRKYPSYSNYKDYMPNIVNPNDTKIILPK